MIRMGILRTSKGGFMSALTIDGVGWRQYTVSQNTLRRYARFGVHIEIRFQLKVRNTWGNTEERVQVVV